MSQPILLFAGLLILSLVACSGSPQAESLQTAAPVTVPAGTLTAAPVPTPTSMPPFLPVLDVIRAENAGEVLLLQTLSIPDFSRGAVSQCSLSFSPDGSLLVGACGTNLVPVWGVDSGEIRFMLLSEPSHEVAVAFSPDGGQIVLGGFTGELRLFSVADGSLLGSFPLSASPLWDLEFAPDGDQLAAAAFSDGVFMWQSTPPQVVWANFASSSTVSPLSVAIHPSGDLVAIGTVMDGIFILDRDTGESLHRMQVSAPIGDVAFNPEGTLLATGSDDNRIRLWSTADYSLVSTWQGHSRWVNGVAFTPDGSLLVSGSHDYAVGLWEVESGELLALLPGHENVVLRVAVNPQGTLIASISWDGTIRLWGVSAD